MATRDPARRVHALRASGATSPWARRCCRPRAASASTSTRCAAAGAVRALPGAGRGRRIRQARRVVLERAACRRSASRSGAIAQARAARGGPATVLFGARRSRRRHRRAREQPGASPGGAQGGRCARHRAGSGRAPALRAGAASPTCTIPPGDLRRLYEALRGRMGRSRDLACDLSVLQSLQPALRAGNWQVTVAVHAGRQIIAVWPGLHERPTGWRSTSAPRRSPRICAI